MLSRKHGGLRQGSLSLQQRTTPVRGNATSPDLRPQPADPHIRGSPQSKALGRARSATSSPCRFAEPTTARFTAPAKRSIGGKRTGIAPLLVAEALWKKGQSGRALIEEQEGAKQRRPQKQRAQKWLPKTIRRVFPSQTDGKMVKPQEEGNQPGPRALSAGRECASMTSQPVA